jgi:AraC family transcriptional regulator
MDSDNRFEGVVRLVAESLAQRLLVKDMAAAARLSPFHFSRCFKEQFGLTPHGYITARRIERARELLQQDNLSLAEVGRTVGFLTHAHFSGAFKRKTGESPGAARRAYRALREQVAAE